MKHISLTLILLIAISLETLAGTGIRLNFKMTGVTHVEIESVDGYALDPANSAYLMQYAPEGGFASGQDYLIETLPCDVYGGLRLSIYRGGLVAHYFCVHQRIEEGEYMIPADLIEDKLEFGDPDAPLVEEERPELDAKTKQLLLEYKKNKTEENKQALLEQMGIRYDKVVARKKAKLRELEREAKHQSLVDDMQAIVDEMVENRDIRLEQQFLRLIDPRTDEDSNDEWMVLRGSSAPNAYIGYTPVTNVQYAQFDSSFSYNLSEADYPVVNVTIADASAYCLWLSQQDYKHTYRLPSDEEWILGAGHMPKDVVMNSNRVESGLTSVDAYSQTTGACGGIDFWGNCWEWTSTQDGNGQYIIKGGSWDSDRDDCRSEKSDVVRNGQQGYANVGFRIVRDESPTPTAIATIQTQHSSAGGMYDLAGKRISRIQKGIIIVGGKKVVGL